jgi:hypothetical protein
MFGTILEMSFPTDRFPPIRLTVTSSTGETVEGIVTRGVFTDSRTINLIHPFTLRTDDGRTARIVAPSCCTITRIEKGSP